jgi:serine/threonine protein kinase
MAETFAALKRGPAGFEQRVCLKRILPSHAHDEEFVRLFLDEAQLAARLRHGNLVTVLDFGEAAGTYFLVLELVDGVDLRALLRHLRREHRTLTSGLAIFLALELGAALDYAHRPDPTVERGGIIHRDLSPSNILLSTAGEVKLADFGIARAVERTRVTRTGVSRGKVPYMAPEYAIDGQCDPRTDLFALGVTLYECLTGRRPHDGASDVDTLRRASLGERVPVFDLLPHAPRGLTEVIERLLAPDPDRRLPSAAALQDALADVPPPPTARRILAELVAAARSPGPVASAPRDSRQRSVAPPALQPPEATTRTAPDLQEGRPTEGDSMLPTVREGPPPGASAEVVTAAEPPARRHDRPQRRWALVGGAAAALTVFVLVTALGAFAVAGLHFDPLARLAPPGPGETTALGASATGPSAPQDGVEPISPADEEPSGQPPKKARETPAPEGHSPGDPARPGAAGGPSAETAGVRSGDTSGPSRRERAGAPRSRRRAASASGDGRTDASRLEEGSAEADSPGSGTVSGNPRDFEPSDRGTLVIRVLPHGEVKVNGRYVGTAPVEVRGLRPGVHRIEVLQDGALIRRSRVRLEAGEVKRITL